jgi:MFS family permease
MILPFACGGAGMALVFAPSANAILSSVRTAQAGQASGANNAIRELGGVLGIAVLSTVFTAHGGYGSAQHYVDGLRPAVWVGVGVLLLGALITLIFSFDTRAESAAVNSVASHGDNRAESALINSAAADSEPATQAPAPTRASAPTAA